MIGSGRPIILKLRMNNGFQIRLILTVAILTIGLFFLLTTIGLEAAFLVDLSCEFSTTVAVAG